MVKTRKDLEFFKVFLPDFSSHELVIPPAFIDVLEKPLPKEALLLDEIGRSWSVETRTEDTDERFRVLFQKGWDVFASDQSLEFGDFLVFSYDGGSRFSVTVFAQDGCRKHLGVDDDGTTTVRSTRVSVDGLNNPVRREDFGNRVNRNREFVLVKDINRRRVNREREACDKAWSPEKKLKRIKREPVCNIPENPHFVRNITPGALRKVEIPTTFLKSNGIELEEDVELCDDKGKKWPLKIVMSEERRLSFSHDSWLSFYERHKAEKPHQCLFEFVVGSNGRCNEIRVRILLERVLTCVKRTRYQVLAM